MKNKTIYWMSRAIRIEENPALEFAISLAKKENTDLEVVFLVQSKFPYANRRNMHFLLSGIIEMAQKLSKQNIPLKVVTDEPLVYFQHRLESEVISSIVTEHHVLRYPQKIHREIALWAKERSIGFYRLNTATVVDVWQASEKLEFAARTFRPKILKQYSKYLKEVEHDETVFDQNVPHVFNEEDMSHILESVKNQEILLADLPSGEEAANRQLQWFLDEGLKNYHLRNQVASKGQSMLSAYLHFGMISIKKVIREVESTKHGNAPLFVEEAMVRRELAENYCYYQSDYDSLEGAWPWAKETLKKAENDPREWIYSLEQFEGAQTHDALWNYCQKQVIQTGYLHSYLRMYWAKMVLYWTQRPEDAIAILVHLNDTYMLDGRDPNGYTGIMWSVAGVHDRPWFTKPITGLVRQMSSNGTMKKTGLTQEELIQE